MMIKLLLDRIRMSSLARNPPSYQRNQLQLPNEPKIHSVKWLTKNDCCNYWSITACTPNPRIKIANINCLI